MPVSPHDIVRRLLRRDATPEELLTELGDDGTETALKQAADAGWIEREESAYRATDMGHDALALALLDTEDHVVVATVDNLGRPSVSPVFFVHDEDDSIYWVSSKSARHSANIRQHAEVALVLFSTAPAVGLYIEATAEEINDPVQLERAVPYVQSKKQPDKFRVNGLADVSGDAVWRIYRARPRAGYRRADAYESEQAVTVRRPIDLLKADQLGRRATHTQTP